MTVAQKQVASVNALQKPVLLKDVAAIAGCSLSVVSKVINNTRGNMGVSDKMRRRILLVADELNYRPNRAAQSLASRKANAIGVYVTPRPHMGMENPWYAPLIIGGIERACREHSYDIMLVNLAGKSELPGEECLRKFEEQRIDGLVIIQSCKSPWLSQLQSYTDRVIAIDDVDNAVVDSVVFDNYAAVKVALEHLLELGHKRIGFIGPIHVNPMQDVIERVKAFKGIMANSGVEGAGDGSLIFDDSKVANRIATTEYYCNIEGGQAVDYFLGLPEDNRPTAVLAYNDLVAAGAIDRFSQAGINVPGDVSVVGIDNSWVCNYTKPRLTSVFHPLDEMGYAAAIHLFNKFDDKQKSISSLSLPRKMLFRPQLIVRESTAKSG